MTENDTIKQAVLYLLSRGQATQAEAANLAGRSRQIVRHWARELPDKRGAYLQEQWLDALELAKRPIYRINPREDA